MEAAKGVSINKAEIKMAARWATQAMLCILNSNVPQLTSVLPAGMSRTPLTCTASFDPDTAHVGCVWLCTGWLVRDWTGTSIIVWVRLSTR